MVDLGEIASPVVVCHCKTADGESKAGRKLGPWNAEYPLDGESVIAVQGSIRAGLWSRVGQSWGCQAAKDYRESCDGDQLRDEFALNWGDLLIDPIGI